MESLTNNALAARLRENAEWCDANEWEIPICMGDDQREAARRLETMAASEEKFKTFRELAISESLKKSRR